MPTNPAITPTEDAVRYWNAVMLECNRRDHTPAHSAGDQRGPTRSARACAIVARAVEDACRTTAAPPLPRRVPIVIPAVPPGAVVDDAASGAAFEALSLVYPKQRSWLVQQLLAQPHGHIDSFNFGREVARAHVKDRESDGASSPDSYTYRSGPGEHQPDPVQPKQEALGPQWGGVRLYASGPAPILILPPPGYVAAGPGRVNRSDPIYRAAVEDVRTNGHGNIAMTPPLGAPEKAMIGTYWGYDGSAELGTPPRLYFQIVRTIDASLSVPLTLQEAASLFSAVATAMADAGVHAWYNKYHYNFWRPSPGIRSHADAGRPLPADPFWLPLGAPDSHGKLVQITPGFPAYPSGHATFGAASLHVAQRCFAKIRPAEFSLNVPNGLISNKGFSFVSDELNGETLDARGITRPRIKRTFSSLWDAIVENGESRVYLGVHWRFDSHPFDSANPTAKPDAATIRDPANLTGGIPLGLKVADLVATAYGY